MQRGNDYSITTLKIILFGMAIPSFLSLYAVTVIIVIINTGVVENYPFKKRKYKHI